MLRTGLLLTLISCNKAVPPEAAATSPAGAAVDDVIDRSVTLTTSPIDERSYAYVQLDNGLRAVVVSDPDTDMASASMLVHVGHYADPPEREGLAHFLEHMLFMGTDEHPEPGEYRKFVKDHGGWTNASTGAEHTQYFFEIEHDHLQGAFDRFARFFVAPTLDPVHVDKERNAVHSEYSLKVQDHARRIRELRKATMAPDHPESKFSVGTLDTLADRDDDTVHAALLDFYQAQYRPDRMTLAILGREPVEELARWVADELGDVPLRDDAPAAAERPPPFADTHRGVRIDMVPLDERRELELQWALPADLPLWPDAPIAYLSSALGHEGEGTLFARLKEQGWIESLSASRDITAAEDVDFLTLRITLTEAGADQIDAIAAAVFATIEQLDEELPEYLHDERLRRRELDFLYAEEADPSRATRAVADALAHLPPEHALDWWSIGTDFDPELLRARLAAMTVDDVRMIVVRPEEETTAELDQEEPRYQVRYRVRPLDEGDRARLTAGTDLDITLPAPNPYLPDDTRLTEGGDPASPPVQLDAGPIDLWHAQDTEFGTPRAQGYLQVYHGAPRADGKRSMVLDYLYEMVLEDALQEFKYPLGLAGLGFSVSADDDGFYLTWWGYDDRQEQLLADVSERVRGLTVDPARFEVQRDRLVRYWRNRPTRRPVDQASWAVGEALDPNDWSVDELLPIAESVDAADVQAYADAYWTHATPRMMVHGNITTEEAQSLAAVLETTLLADTEPADEVRAVRRLIDPGVQLVRDVAVDHDDSALVVRYLSPTDDLHTQARWRLLGALISTPFFAELRTEQQLGYVASAGFRSANRLPGLRMRIQSTVADPDTLLERVDGFLASFAQTLQEMPDDEFAAIRGGLVARLREADTQAYDRYRGYRTDLFDGITTFDQDERVAAHVEGLDRETMHRMATELFLTDEPTRLVARAFGHAHAEAAEAAEPGCPDEACLLPRLGQTWSRPLSTLVPPADAADGPAQ